MKTIAKSKMEGLQLNTWAIGKKIGEGNCADVYQVVSTISLEYNYDRVKEFVIKIAKVPTKPNGRSTKAYKDAMRLADTLHSEYMVYNKLHGIDGIPYVPIRAYGECKGYRYLVVERLERSLEDILQTNGPLQSSVAARYGSQMIKVLQTLHSKNVLYVDMKPENIMIKDAKAHCVDFGITGQFMTMKGLHKEQTQSKQIIGTPTFASLRCHEGISNSRRDDIESLLYVLIYLMKGSLPWIHARSNAEGANIKKQVSIDMLCGSLPEGWSRMVDAIRKCEFSSRPDYQYFQQQFESMM